MNIYSLQRKTLKYLTIIHFITIPLFIHKSVQAQNFTGGFNFNLPPDDTTGQIFLPTYPVSIISENNFVSIDNDGHFSIKGIPVRFFGTNCVFGGAFPNKTKAGFISGRLRKTGFNLIRFHHMDNPGDNSLFEINKDTRHLNSGTLDRLEYFINELKKNGIYANINLHVSRTFNLKDGVPQADSITEHAKGVSYFDPQLISLHKEFAKQLLTHKNPYTGLTLAADPVMAMLEITNENSLYRMWKDGALKPFASGGSLICRHNMLLDSLWYNYLVSKYQNTQSLRNAWEKGTVNISNDQVNEGGFENNPINKYWELEIHSPAAASMALDPINPYQGNFSAKINVTNIDNTGWHIQWKQTTLSIKKDSIYTISFAARSNSKRKVLVSILQNISPWTYFGGQEFSMDTDWKTFKFSIKANADCPVTRLSFNLGIETGIYWFDNIKFTNREVLGLTQDENLENRSIKRIAFNECPNYSEPRVIDISGFYIKLQNDFFSDMVNYLKNEIGVKVPIVGTNWNIGAPDLAVQSNLDYIDNHSYWDHPQFPGIPWSSIDWKINNTQMALSASGGTIPSLMGGVGFYKKPFTISEYNHAFPNRYQTEGVLFLSAYASFHDVDGIMFFDYNGSVNDWETDMVNGYFDIHRNTAMMSLIPSCAYAYRNFYISKAKNCYYLEYNQDDYLKYAGRAENSWEGMIAFPRKIALQHSIRNKSFNSFANPDISFLPPEPVNPYETDTKELVWNTDGLFYVSTGKFTAVTGLLNNLKDKNIGDLTIINCSDFSTLTWISLTGIELPKSGRSLITLSSVIQNTNMMWDGITTVHNKWGSAPTLIKPIAISLKLNIEADSIKVFPLNTSGGKMIGFYTLKPQEPNTYYITIDQTQTRTVWYGIEKFGLGTVKINETQPPQKFNLSIFPNPFNNSTTIRYSIPVITKVGIDVFDILGKKVRTLIKDRIEKAGEFSIFWNGKDDYNTDVVSGLYLIRLNTPLNSEIKKIILIK